MDGFPRECDTIKAMFATGDYSGIEFVAHRLIGSAGNAGLSDIASLASGLQDAASKRDKQKIGNSLSQLANFST